MSENRVSTSLEVVQPFDFRQSLNFLGMFSPAAGEQNLTEQKMTKAVYIEGQLVVFRVEPEADHLRCTFFSEKPLSADRLEAARERVSFFLSLRDDLKPFYALAEDDRHFAPIVERLYGYHQVKFLTPFENACWAILTSRNRMSIASSIKNRITATFGGAMTLDGEMYRTFPQPIRVAHVPLSDLSQIIGNERRAEYMFAVARAFADVDESWLRTGDYEAVKAWLLSIRGIGVWSAYFVMLRSLGRVERVVAPESRLLEAASHIYQRHFDAESLCKLAAHYGEYQGYWAHYVRVAA